MVASVWVCACVYCECVCLCVCVCLFLGYKNTNLLLLISYSTRVCAVALCLFVYLWRAFEVLLHYKLQLNYCMTPSLRSLPLYMNLIICYAYVALSMLDYLIML